MLICLFVCLGAGQQLFYWIKQFDMTTFEIVGDLEGICLGLFVARFLFQEEGLDIWYVFWTEFNSLEMDFGLLLWALSGLLLSSNFWEGS